MQEIASDAHQGQILSRGFKVHFSGYSTSLIPHDATSDRLKAEMEDAILLNLLWEK